MKYLFLIVFLSYLSLILISQQNVNHPGLPIGNSKNDLKRQIIKSPFDFLTAVIPEYK